MREPNRVFATHQDTSVSGLFARNAGLSVAGRPLLVGAGFAVAGGRKVALVGRNGSGKSTLIETVLRVAEDGRPPDHVQLSGRLELGPGTTVAAVRQDVQLSFAGSVDAYLDRCAGEVSRAWNEHERWSQVLARGRDGAEALTRYGGALEEMARIEAWDYPARRQRVLDGLRLAPALGQREVVTLSGGEATRVALAGVLLSPASLVLLDEPSNNLDLESIAFLADWIRRSRASLLLVSHDRELLDATVQEILEIDEGSGRLLSFGGDYTFYAARKREAFEAQLKAFQEQQGRRRRLEASAEGLARRADRFQNTSQNDFYRSKAARVARAASAQRSRVRRQLSAAEDPSAPAQPRFEVQQPAISSGTVVRAQGLSFEYSGQPLFHGLDVSLRAGRRLAVVGPNGSGKSTLLRLLAGELAPAAGVVERAPGLRLGYMPQLSIPDPEESALDFVLRRVDAPGEEVRAILGKVLFGDPARLRAADLSVGQLRRVECAALFAARPDLLLMDEPTNHIDLPTIDMLERALDDYGGAVVACSHDRRFLGRLRPDARLSLEAGSAAVYSSDL